MSSNHYHIQDPDDGFFPREEPSERCMEPPFPPLSPTFIAPFDPMILDDIFPPLEMQLPTDLAGIDPAPDMSSSASPVSSVIYDGDSCFDLQTGLWAPTQPNFPSVEPFFPSPVESSLAYPEIAIPTADSTHGYNPPTSPPSLSTNNSQGPSSRTTTPGFSSMPATPKALPCPVPGCPRSFDTNTDLQKHRRAHNKRFHCQRCGKAHSDQRGLDRHMESRHKVASAKSEKRKCRVCGRVGRGDNIKRHEKGQHGLE